MVFDASGGNPPGGPGAAGESGGGESGRPLLGGLLVQAQVITPGQLAEALAAQSEPANAKKIGQLLIERGWMTEAQLTQTLSLQLSVPWVSLYHIDFSRQLLNRVPRELAERYCLIPIFVRHVKGQGETLYVAMDDPTNEIALAEVARQASLPARPMIASATDIRSAIRVYYGDPEAPGQTVDMPPRAAADAPMTTREGQVRREPAPPTPPVATQPDPPRQSYPPRAPSHAPPAPPAAARRQPQAHPGAVPSPAGSSPSVAANEDGEVPPPTTRSNPPPGARAALAAAAAGGGSPPAAAATGAAGSGPAQPLTEDQGVPRAEGSEPRRGRGKMLSLTLLDGTTISLPATKGVNAVEGLTANDFVSALRATAHGADATEILGAKPQWEPVVAALLSILLRKGLIADWEFIEELRKI